MPPISSRKILFRFPREYSPSAYLSMLFDFIVNDKPKVLHFFKGESGIRVFPVIPKLQASSGGITGGINWRIVSRNRDTEMGFET
jgi:hypothetical protein